MASPIRAPVEIGETIAGKYRVERIIGAGGMGIVVAATHVALDQRVAIKFLLSTHAKDEIEVARFAREARALAKIECDNVARVIDVGTLDDGASYMVMEYLEGKDLSAIIRERGPIPSGQAIAWVLEACEAVIEAHAAGIIHRDLKPANLFLAQRKSQRTIVKVLDFGISKAIGGQAATMDMLALTKTAALLGSPLYMAPEQLRSVKDLDGRTDIWGLGVILYELLTARPPFLADSLGALVSSIQDDPPVLPHLRQPSVPEEVSRIVVRCLAKKREERYPTVLDLTTALQPFSMSSSSSSSSSSSTSLPPTSDDDKVSVAKISDLASTTDPIASTLSSLVDDVRVVSPAAETTGPPTPNRVLDVTGPPVESKASTGPRTTERPENDRIALGASTGSGRDSAWGATKGGGGGAARGGADAARGRAGPKVIAIVLGVGVLLAIGAVAASKISHNIEPTYARPYEPPEAPSASASTSASASASASASIAPSAIPSASATSSAAPPPVIAKPKPTPAAKPSVTPAASSAAPPPTPTTSIPVMPTFPIK